MSTLIALPPPVAAIIAAALPGAPIAELEATVGGFSNLSAAARIGRARCGIKAAEMPAEREDLRREQLVPGLLRGRGPDVPAAVLEPYLNQIAAG